MWANLEWNRYLVLVFFYSVCNIFLSFSAFLLNEAKWDLHNVSVYCEEKLFLTLYYLEFLRFILCWLWYTSLFLYNFFKLWVFLIHLIYRNGCVTFRNPHWTLKVFLNILNVCHRSEINDIVTMNSCFRTVCAPK